MTSTSSLAANPFISDWLTFKDARILLRSGKVEIGQGIGTSLMQIAADALIVDQGLIELESGATGHTPNEGWTSASISIEVGGASVRLVCRKVLGMFMQAAASYFGVELEDISVADGRFYHSGTPERLSYFELQHQVNLHQRFDEVVVGEPPTIQNLVGQRVPRRDIPRKVSGAAFLHDHTVPDMLHGRVLRGPRITAQLISIELDKIKGLVGVDTVVVDGNFVGICGADEAHLAGAYVKAKKMLQWSTPIDDGLTDFDEHLRSQKAEVTSVYQHSTGSGIAKEFTVEARYKKPFIAHASIGTVCAIASFEDRSLSVWSQSQGVYPLRGSLAKFFSLQESQVRVVHMEGAGCYGHNGADDVALDAAILSRAMAKPVRVIWMRDDELARSPFGAAMTIDVVASCTAQGRLVDWMSHIYSFGHLIRPGWGETINLLAATEVAEPFPAPDIVDPPMLPFGGGGTRNSVPLYELENADVTYHLVKNCPYRTSALRSLGAFANVFAIESVIDELATLSGCDPLAIRLNNLTDDRAAAVIRAVCADANYDAHAKGTGAWGRGLGFARYKNSGAYFACLVEVELSETIRVEKVFAAVDAGEVINPDGLENQIEGGIVQAISWTLKEQVEMGAKSGPAETWEQYNIIGFDEIPETIKVKIMTPKGHPHLGVGECAAGPVAAAIANAVAHAIDIRIRDLPITFTKLVAAMA